MTSAFQIQLAARHIVDGAVVAYPTEGVFGIGCAADDSEAIARVVQAKGRDARKGLILLTGTAAHLEGWVAIDPQTLPPPVANEPLTWIVPAGERCDPLVTGGRATVAVRITDHRVAAAVANEAGTPLISTSANKSGGAPLTSALAVRRTFGGVIDHIVPGELGSADGASEIRDFLSGTVLRPRLAPKG